MKILNVVHNNRKKGFQIRTSRASYWFPYARLDVRPTSRDPVVSVCADRELGREGFTYALMSGKEGTVHIDHVLDYNKDPGYLRDLLLHKLSLEAQERIKGSPLTRREIIRRLGTSPAQLYRLLDQTNYRKSIDQVLSLLYVLDCDVDMAVRAKRAAATAARPMPKRGSSPRAGSRVRSPGRRSVRARSIAGPAWRTP